MRFGLLGGIACPLGAGLALMLLLVWACHGQVWERLGPNGGDVISMAGSADGTLFLGTSDGHVFASLDAAAHWELRGRAGARLDGVVQHLLVDSRSPKRIFAALWFQDPAAGGGIYRSDDGGRTWQLLGLRGEAVRALEQSGTQPEILIAGSRTGIFRSIDSGLQWERISPVGDQEFRNIDSLAIDPADARVIYAGTYHLPWKTSDGGKTWLPIANGMIDDSDVMSLHIDAVNPSRIFASACSGIYRSENSGSSWIKLQGIPYSSRRTQSFAQDPRDPLILYAGTTEGLWMTRDLGESWTRATPRDWIINSVALAASSTGSSKVVLGTDFHGVLVSDDLAANFHLANTGFSHRVVAALLSDSRDSQHLLAHLSGNPSTLLESRDSGRSWHPLPGQEPASGIEKLFATKSGWWAALSGGGAARYDDAATKWLRLNFRAIPASRTPRRPAPRAHHTRSLAPAHDPHAFDIQASPSRVYIAADDGLWSGEPARPLVRCPNSVSLTEVFSSLDVLASDSEIWTITTSKLLHSKDEGRLWSDETPAFSHGALLWVRIRASESGSVLFLGTQTGVYRHPLEANAPWQLLQSGLPAAATNSMWSSASSIVLSAKAGGLYLSRDAGNTWQRLDSSKEESIITGIASDGLGGLIIGSRMEGILHWFSGLAGNKLVDSQSGNRPHPNRASLSR